jgi:hypothetical protein
LHDDVRPVEQIQAAHRPRSGHELDVRLVDHHHEVCGQPVEQRHHVVVRERGPGRVVGSAEQQHTRVRGHRSGESLQVVHRTGSEGHRTGRRAGELHRDRVRLEAPPGVDHLVAGFTQGVQQVVQHRHRPGAERDPLRAHVQPRRHGRRECGVAHVRIAVHLRTGLNGRSQHLRQRRIGILVARQLVRRPRLSPGSRRLPCGRAGRQPRPVDRQARHGRPDADGHS